MARKGYADEGYVDPNDPVNQQYTDPMGGVYGGIQGATEPNWYDKASDIVAKAGATVGSPVIAGLRGAGESMNKAIYDRPLGYTEKERAEYPRFTQATEEYYKPVQHVGRVLMSPFAGMIGGSGEFVREGAEQLGAEPNLARQLGRETSSMVEWGMTRGDMISPRAPTDVSSIPRRGEVLPPERNAVTRMPEAPRVIDADTPYRVISGEVTPAEMPRDTARVTAEPMRQLEAPQEAPRPAEAARVEEPVAPERPVEAPVAQEAPRQPEPARAAEPPLTYREQRYRQGYAEERASEPPRAPRTDGEPIFRDGLTLPEYQEKFKLKPRGGNWLSSFLAEGEKVNPSKTGKPNVSFLDDALWRLKEVNAEQGLQFVPEPEFGEAPRQQPELPPHIPHLTKWIDTKLKKYVMNDMGTTHDPLFDLAEQGQDLHVPQDQIRGGTFRGIPAYHGQTELSSWWSNAANSALRDPSKKLAAGHYYGSDWSSMKDQIPSWLNDLPSDATFYDLRQPYRLNDLGFDHLVDELANATRADSNLPQNLRLDPAKLDRVTMPQAVQLVDKINKWREENAKKEKLEGKDNAAVKPIQEYPDGNKWVEISTPDDPNMSPEQKTQLLDKALKYEGDVMGHCVGGYCKKVEAKSSEIFSLRDAKGEPHVTIETAPAKPELTKDDMLEIQRQVDNEFNDESLALSKSHGSLSGTNWVQSKEANDLWDDLGRRITARKKEIRAEVLRTKAETLPARVVQIKGKGNKKPADKYIPMVQDFIRSHEWSDIGDYRNADLFHHSEIQNFIPSFGDVPRQQRIAALDKAREEGKIPKYATATEWEEALKLYLPEGSVKSRRAGGRTNYEIGDYLHRDYFSLGGFEPDAGYVEPEYKAYTPMFSEDAQPATQEEQSYPMGRREDPIAPVRQGAEERATYDPLTYVTPRAFRTDDAVARMSKSYVMPYEGDGPIAGDLSRNSVLYNSSRPALNPAALVVHHTAGRGNPEGVMNALNQQGYGVHYIVDRDGKIYASLPSNVAGIHTGTSAIPGINNATTYGVEVIANDDSDILPSQVEAVRSLYGHLQKGNPKLAIYGHGEIGSHKRADEGKTVVSAIRGGEFVPARQVLAKVPIEKRTLRSYGTGEFNSGGTAKGSESSEKPVAFEGTPWRFIDSASSFDIGPGTEPSSQAMEGMVTGSIGVPVGGGRLSAYGSMNPAIAILPKFPGKNEIMYPTYGVTYKKSFKSGGTITDKALMIVSKLAKSRRGRPK
jgi:hypothetical protein